MSPLRAVEVQRRRRGADPAPATASSEPPRGPGDSVAGDLSNECHVDRCKPAEVHLDAGDMDIALLELRMPDRCGDDFGKELRQRCPQTMIVFVTGESMLESLKAAVPDCFVMRKPIDVAVLLQLMECFGTDRRYAVPPTKRMADHARPGNM